MALNIHRTMQEEGVKRLKSFPIMEAAIALIVIIVLAALFIDTRNMPQRGAPRLAQSGGGTNAIEFDGITVNPVIAKDFNLAQVAGVLVNDVPKGSARRLIDLRRGDVILKYNTVDVQSANHLAYLMSQSKPGDRVTFVITRAGRTLKMSDKLPVNAGMDIFGANGRDIMVVLVIITITFTMLFLNLFNRTVCVTLGAVLMLVAGSVFGFYNQSEAFDAIRMSPIFIFMGMSIFAIFLEDLRFFEYAAKKMIVSMKADRIRVVFALCIMTFIASALVNNMSVILVIIPITIYAAKGMGFAAIPVVIAEIISSVIGGNMTPIGDFSNMLMASSAGLTFLDFLIVMGPICCIFLAVFLWYMWFFEWRHNEKVKSAKLEKAFLVQMQQDLKTMKMDWPNIKKVLYILGAVLVAFMILPIFKVHLAPIALGGGFLLLAIENHKAKDVIKRLSLTDMLFFIALFLIVGGALYSGLLKVVSNGLITMAMGNKVLYPILLMITMAFFTALMNSGPATAFLVPVVMHSGFADFSDVVWWALNLGSIIGACACISGASAGIISQTLMEELGNDLKHKEGLTFGSYARRGLPVAGILLLLSTVYIIFLSILP
ncbi:MAG: PDZ domain-containing protein [Candidatus Omnitrophica bacterium]|nr:PDZ domain-containing protein [Candidatus Omnitrophota bacterium]